MSSLLLLCGGGAAPNVLCGDNYIMEKYDITLKDLVEVMAEELEGINAYKAMCEKATDGETKALLTHILTDEKKHVQALLAHINDKAKQALM